MTVARMLTMGLLTLLLAAPAGAKQRHFKLHYPPAGQASLGQLTSKGKPAKPRLKGKLPKDVGLVVGARKTGKRWSQLIVVFRRKASSRAVAHAAGASIRVSRDGAVFFYDKRVTAKVHPSFLLGGTPLTQDVCRGIVNGGVPSFVGVTGRGLLPGANPQSVLGNLVLAGCGRSTGAATQALLCANALLGCNSTGGNSGGDNTGNNNSGNSTGTPAPFAFTTGPTFDPPANAHSIVTGDFNGDGHPDLILGAGSGSSGSINLFPGGAGTIGSPTSTSTNFSVDGLASGDFNGDGHPDVAGLGDLSGILQSFSGDGHGTFTGAPQFTFNPSGKPFSGPGAGLANGDGRADLIVGQFDGQVASLGGQTDGSFSPFGAGDFNAGGSGNPVFAVTFGRINGDAFSDVVAAENGPGGTFPLVVLPGAGDGTFGAPIVTNLGGSPSSVAAGDIDLDGFTDIAVAETSQNQVELFPGLGTGSFGTPTTLTLPSGSNPVDVVTADVNGDGAPDVLVLNQGTGTLTAFINTKSGRFGDYAAPVNTLVGGNPISMAPLDVNGDGHADIAVFGASSGGIFVAP